MPEVDTASSVRIVRPAGAGHKPLIADPPHDHAAVGVVGLAGVALDGDNVSLSDFRDDAAMLRALAVAGEVEHGDGAGAIATRDPLAGRLVAVGECGAAGGFRLRPWLYL